MKDNTFKIFIIRNGKYTKPEFIVPKNDAYYAKTLKHSLKGILEKAIFIRETEDFIHIFI